MTRRRFLASLAVCLATPALSSLRLPSPAPQPLSAGRRYQVNATAWVARTKGTNA